MHIRVVDEVDSTQDELIARVGQHAEDWPHLSGLRARVQRRGRGRLGRVWQTEGVRALTISYVLRPDAPLTEWATLALRGGVGVIRALDRAGVPACLKWPNDIVVATAEDHPGWHGIAKVGGILGTVVRDGDGAHVCILGIGINLAGAGPVAGSAALEVPLDAAELAAAIQAELAALIPASGPAQDSLGELMAKHCHTVGKNVTVTFPAADPPRQISGRALRVDPDGALVVDTGGAQERILNGDIAHTRLTPR